MRVTVQPLSATRVLIVLEPSIVERILYGRMSHSELARKEPHGWIYAERGGWVGLQIESEIDDVLGCPPS